MLLRLELLLELRVRNKAVRGRSRAAIMLLNVRRESSARPALGRAAPVGRDLFCFDGIYRRVGTSCHGAGGRGS